MKYKLLVEMTCSERELETMVEPIKGLVSLLAATVRTNVLTDESHDSPFAEVPPLDDDDLPPTDDGDEPPEADFLDDLWGAEPKQKTPALLRCDSLIGFSLPSSVEWLPGEEVAWGEAPDPNRPEEYGEPEVMRVRLPRTELELQASAMLAASFLEAWCAPFSSDDSYVSLPDRGGLMQEIAATPSASVALKQVIYLCGGLNRFVYAWLMKQEKAPGADYESRFSTEDRMSLSEQELAQKIAGSIYTLASLMWQELTPTYDISTGWTKGL